MTMFNRKSQTDPMAIVKRITETPQFRLLLQGLGAIAGVPDHTEIPVQVGLAANPQDPTQIAICVMMEGPDATLGVTISKPDNWQPRSPDARPSGAALN